MSNGNIENIIPDNYKKRGVYTPAKKVKMGDQYLIFVSGIQPPKDENHRAITDDVEKQTILVFEEIASILARANATMDDVVKAVVYITDIGDLATISKIRDEYFKSAMPVSTLVEVNRMTRDGAKVEIEVTAMMAC